jgi:hypothetical protein
MEVQVWQMIVSTERELMERRLERKARHGLPAVSSLVSKTRKTARGWRFNPFGQSPVQPREAS